MGWGWCSLKELCSPSRGAVTAEAVVKYIDAREVSEEQTTRENGPVLPDRDLSQKLAEAWGAG